MRESFARDKESHANRNEVLIKKKRKSGRPAIIVEWNCKIYSTSGGKILGELLKPSWGGGRKGIYGNGEKCETVGY